MIFYSIIEIKTCQPQVLRRLPTRIRCGGPARSVEEGVELLLVVSFRCLKGMPLSEDRPALSL